MPIPGQLSPLDQITSLKTNVAGPAFLTASQGWIAESYQPFYTVTANTAVTSQKIFGTAIALTGGQIINNVVVHNALAASGTLPTKVVVGLADATGNVVVKSSADLTTLASHPAGFVSFPLSAAYTVPSTGKYFAFYLTNGVFGTNVPTFATKTYAAALEAASQTLFGSFGTGQTDIPAVGASLGTFSAAESVSYWFAVS